MEYFKYSHIKMSDQIIRPQDFRVRGVIRNYNGKDWSYYDEADLPGGALEIPGRHTDDNLVKDGDGNICLASKEITRGVTVLTPIMDPNGAQYNGKIYDYCDTAGRIDVYVSFRS